MTDGHVDQDFTGVTSTGVDPRLSAVLSYTAWWVSGLIFLVIEPRHRGVRFHAAQSLVVFGGLSIIIALLSGFSIAMLLVSAVAFQVTRMIAELVWLVAVVIWMIVMIKTFKGETWRVPGAADLADRLAGPLT